MQGPGHYSKIFSFLKSLPPAISPETNKLIVMFRGNWGGQPNPREVCNQITYRTFQASQSFCRHFGVWLGYPLWKETKEKKKWSDSNESFDSHNTHGKKPLSEIAYLLTKAHGISPALDTLSLAPGKSLAVSLFECPDSVVSSKEEMPTIMTHCHSLASYADLFYNCELNQIPRPENFPHPAAPPEVKETQRALESGDSMKKPQVAYREGIMAKDRAEE
ncbi:hypothetical protein TURU_037415 [Turdus rufiventris]|nr:hypothetical protein TURU_037415 [Turdus rufiventris]